MITFRKAQSIALWMHIPMWVVVSVVIVIIGAYHAGIRNAEAKSARRSASNGASHPYVAAINKNFSE